MVFGLPPWLLLLSGALARVLLQQGMSQYKHYPLLTVSKIDSEGTQVPRMREVVREHIHEAAWHGGVLQDSILHVRAVDKQPITLKGNEVCPLSKALWEGERSTCSQP